MDAIGVITLLFILFLLFSRQPWVVRGFCGPQKRLCRTTRVQRCPPLPSTTITWPCLRPLLVLVTTMLLQPSARARELPLHPAPGSQQAADNGVVALYHEDLLLLRRDQWAQPAQVLVPLAQLS